MVAVDGTNSSPTLFARDAKTFACEIEAFVQSHSCDYIEALMAYQEKNSLETETLSALVKQCPSLKTKLYEEAQGSNTVKRETMRLKFAT